MLTKIILISLLLCHFTNSQQPINNGFDFGNLLKDFMQGDGIKNIQNIYSALPSELRDKFTKNLLSNPNQFGQDMMNMIGPQFQNIVSGVLGNLGKEFGNGLSESGFDLSSIGSMVGNLISTNPQMMITMVQGLIQDNGINYESITTMMMEKFDLDTIMSLASTFGIDKNFPKGEAGGNAMEGIKSTVIEALKLNQIYKSYETFMKSPIGKKLHFLLPRLIKAKTLPDALRLLEKETSVRFDTIMLQLRDTRVRKILVKQMIQPATNFLKSVTIPEDMKQLITKSDELLNKKLGLDITVNWIEPIVVYIRDRFKITRESLLHLTPDDLEHIIHQLLNEEIFDPLNTVLDVHAKVKQNYECRNFIFCQFNHNQLYGNFIKRNVIKLTSIATAFQLKRNDNDFVEMYNSVYNGNDGKDCTVGVNSICLSLMDTPSHNEL